MKTMEYTYSDSLGPAEELFWEPAAEASRAFLHGYNLPSCGVALEGHCPVSYFEANRAVLGGPEFAVTYDGVTYYMASWERKLTFESNPEKYIPAYGGWCAFGMTLENNLPIDPHAFKIVDGRLLLFLRNENIDAIDLWNQGDEKIKTFKAETNWKRIRQYL